MLGLREMVESAALTFGAATNDHVDCGSAASIDALDPWTFLLIVKPTTLNLSRTIFQKGASGTGTRGPNMIVADSLGNVQIQLDRATTDLDYVTTDLPLVLNTWSCVGASFWSGGTAGALVRIFGGVYPSPATYRAVTAKTDGSGAYGSDASENLRIGNGKVLTIAFQGQIAAVALFDRVLSLPEIVSWQFSALDEPLPSVMAGCRGLWYPGNDGPNTVIDYSGYHNDGTVTGATLSRGVCLPAITDVTRMVA